MNEYKPGIYRWRRVPIGETLGRLHTNLVEIVETKDKFNKDGMWLVQFHDGTRQWAHKEDVTGPYDPFGKLLPERFYD